MILNFHFSETGPAALSACSISWVSCLLQKHRFQRQQQCWGQTAAVARATQRPDPLLELTRSEVFAPQLGRKEGCWTKEQTSSVAHQHHLRSEPHALTHMHTHASQHSMENVRMSGSLTDTPPGEAARSLKGRHCHSPSHYYWANHSACPLPSSPLYASTHLHVFFLLCIFSFLFFSAGR